MYPRRDFRHLVSDPTTDYETLIQSISREPFEEILYYWNLTQKPIHLHQTYSDGIKRAILKDRYMISQLSVVKHCPEFIPVVLDSLLIYWNMLSFSFEPVNGSILVDMGTDNTTSIDKKNILEKKYTGEVYLSDRAADICVVYGQLLNI